MSNGDYGNESGRPMSEAVPYALVETPFMTRTQGLCLVTPDTTAYVDLQLSDAADGTVVTDGVRISFYREADGGFRRIGRLVMLTSGETVADGVTLDPAQLVATLRSIDPLMVRGDANEPPASQQERTLKLVQISGQCYDNSLSA